jgi:anaerobic dimethyl sulfoxide reductase subunit B (iron-sulfur subunit)
MQYGFYFNAERCIGCNACVIACKDWNDLKPGELVYWRRVTTTESGKGLHVQLTNQSLSCLHCGKPSCLAACPQGAISKRSEDGIVVVDQLKCQGCRTCLEACPFGIPQYGPDGKMQICNFCTEKIRAGMPPACAAACTGKALFAAPLDELARLFADKFPVRMFGDTEPSMLVPTPKKPKPLDRKSHRVTQRKKKEIT